MIEDIVDRLFKHPVTPSYLREGFLSQTLSLLTSKAIMLIKYVGAMKEELTRRRLQEAVQTQSPQSKKAINQPAARSSSDGRTPVPTTLNSSTDQLPHNNHTTHNAAPSPSSHHDISKSTDLKKSRKRKTIHSDEEGEEYTVVKRDSSSGSDNHNSHNNSPNNSPILPHLPHKDEDNTNHVLDASHTSNDDPTLVTPSDGEANPGNTFNLNDFQNFKKQIRDALALSEPDFVVLLGIAEKILPGSYVNMTGNPAWIEEKLIELFEQF